MAPIPQGPASAAAGKNEHGKRPRDWRGAGGDGSKAPALKNADVLKREEAKVALSSIKSKLTAPKSAAASSKLTDDRKTKVGSLSAGLTREQIRSSQEQHRSKMESLGKPVPSYRNH
uniref:Uncharacterized protein n=1 Tax=Calcidiscus leptoporus TaxID=127549 RepID=A0A7S0P5Y0_9EUKA|mmetsp:Transcript_58689/g.134616  ORF Transcript_58689/g.134616 Transcript_58689/m.134616 type:complete len:117 (+) Transcript_58689:26-376(+)